jgi:REP element-mobilizing transposase RayT
MAFDPEKHHRRSIRLKGYDYSQPGAYFVTICTHDRGCLFGEVVDEAMQLNDAGRVAAATWDALPSYYPGVELDAFVVMPNHVHGMIIVEANVGAIHESPLPESPQRKFMGVVNRRRMVLSKIIGRFKMVSAKRINILRNTPGMTVWQRNYYEHIIRDEDELSRIREYIVNNPLQWAVDRENPSTRAAQVSPPRCSKDEPWRV